MYSERELAEARYIIRRRRGGASVFSDRLNAFADAVLEAHPDLMDHDEPEPGRKTAPSADSASESDPILGTTKDGRSVTARDYTGGSILAFLDGLASLTETGQEVRKQLSAADPIAEARTLGIDVGAVREASRTHLVMGKHVSFETCLRAEIDFRRMMRDRSRRESVVGL